MTIPNQHELFYIRIDGVFPDELIFDAEESRHISVSLRKSKGQVIGATDGKGTRFETEITSTKDCVRARIINRIETADKPTIDFTLAQAVIKGERFDWLVEKAVELGARRIVPFTSRFTVLSGAEKTGRWRRVALSAMKQSHRLFLPEISPTVSFAEMLRIAKEKPVRLLADAEGSISIREILESKPTEVFGLVGPEGGFSKEEIGRVMEAGFTAVKLSDARLRAETAGTVLTAMVMD